MNRLYRWLWLHRNHGATCPWEPTYTGNMMREGVEWAWFPHMLHSYYYGHWGEVCSKCGGNCGQCGMTDRLGNVPASMDRLARLHSQ